MNIARSFKFWLCTYISAWISYRILVACLYHLILPECRGGGCTIVERLLTLLDFFGPILLLMTCTYAIFLNCLFVRKFSLVFSCLIGFGAGLGTIVLYPSDGTEKISEFLDFIDVPNSDLGFWITIATYLLLFGSIFSVMTGVYFLFLKIRDLKRIGKLK